MPLLEGEIPADVKKVHIMGIGGTAMAALAGMLVDAGYQVTGSDTGVYPPMSDYLASLGIEVQVGYNAENLRLGTPDAPDLVVVGNVIRKTYPEAEALLASPLRYGSFPQILGSLVLRARHSVVVAGTHGKTTTTSLAAWALESAGLSPGFLIGGRAKNFDRTARAGQPPYFVIEGDEYDTAFFDKGSKFLHYYPKTAILTSVEYDHADIFPDFTAYKATFEKFVRLIPTDGTLVARWDHDAVVEVARDASCALRRYGPGQAWDGRVEKVDTTTGRQTFAVLRDGALFGRFESLLVGSHNLYNQVAVVAALDSLGVSVPAIAAGLASFAGIKRRQDVLGEPRQIAVVDDFAHHPTAVVETLAALRLRFGQRRMWAIFEPRSNTSRRKVFQDAYAEAFDDADVVIIATPPDQGNIPLDERFDSQLLVQRLRARGKEAFTYATPQDIAAVVSANAHPHDVVAVLSNGSFGGLHGLLLESLK